MSFCCTCSSICSTAIRSASGFLCPRQGQLLVQMGHLRVQDGDLMVCSLELGTLSVFACLCGELSRCLCGGHSLSALQQLLLQLCRLALQPCNLLPELSALLCMSIPSLLIVLERCYLSPCGCHILIRFLQALIPSDQLLLVVLHILRSGLGLTHQGSNLFLECSDCLLRQLVAFLQFLLPKRRLFGFSRSVGQLHLQVMTAISQFHKFHGSLLRPSVTWCRMAPKTLQHGNFYHPRGDVACN
mmetsp:Transcript_44909/g.106603  ORF Transcript_44909/g.106603 Transcript_44909/m.106603 type:complete len:243 (-) Transcript_44909:149-877(-)